MAGVFRSARHAEANDRFLREPAAHSVVAQLNQ
jgi:hypothetical protein